MSTGLGREDIRALLDDLSAELAARGARAELFLVGGAALAVAMTPRGRAVPSFCFFAGP